MIDVNEPRKFGEKPIEARERDSDEEWFQLFSRHFAEIAGSVSRLGHLRAARWQVRAGQLVAAGFLGLTLAVVTAATGLAGVWLIFRGLPRTLTGLLGGREGLAELLGGVILLGGVVLLVLALQRWSERRILRRLEDRDGD